MGGRLPAALPRLLLTTHALNRPGCWQAGTRGRQRLAGAPLQVSAAVCAGRGPLLPLRAPLRPPGMARQVRQQAWAGGQPCLAAGRRAHSRWRAVRCHLDSSAGPPCVAAPCHWLAPLAKVCVAILLCASPSRLHPLLMSSACKSSPLPRASEPSLVGSLALLLSQVPMNSMACQRRYVAHMPGATRMLSAVPYTVTFTITTWAREHAYGGWGQC